MTIKDLIDALEKGGGMPRFASFIYTSKKRGETARWTLLIGADYVKLCRESITELQIQLQTATGIAKVVIPELIASLEESIACKLNGTEHSKYTKAGIYKSLCTGLKVNTNDMTCEIQGVLHSYQVITPGKPKVAVNHRNPITAASAEIRETLKVSKWTTLAVDLGTFHGARVNGEELILE